jgi:hypothetical protein
VTQKNNNAWAGMNKAWAEEVATVLASEGLPWQPSSCWCDQRTSSRCAEVTHRSTGNTRTIKVTEEHAATPATRRAEIVRQLRS